MTFRFRCGHRKTSQPVMERREDDVINRITNSFVVCRDCSERIPYSPSESRVVGERRKTQEDGAVTVRGVEAEGRARKAESARLNGPSSLLNQAKASTADASPRPAKISQLHKLALHYHSQDQYEQAERLYKDILAMVDTVRLSIDPEVGQVLNNLARLYHPEAGTMRRSLSTGVRWQPRSSTTAVPTQKLCAGLPIWRTCIKRWEETWKRSLTISGSFPFWGHSLVRKSAALRKS